MMKNVRILDCTLRDGGRIIDCAFPDEETKEISRRLAEAKIDIIEVGFLRDRRKVNYQGNSTFFTDVDQIRPFVNKEKKGVLYTAFIDYGMCDIDTLKERPLMQFDLDLPKRIMMRKKKRLSDGSMLSKKKDINFLFRELIL